MRLRGCCAASGTRAARVSSTPIGASSKGGDTMQYALPGQTGTPVDFKQRYDNFIGGKFVPPMRGQYFDNVTPITGKPFCQAARSTEEDISLALDAAHAAADKWGR